MVLRGPHGSQGTVPSEKPTSIRDALHPPTSGDGAAERFWAMTSNPLPWQAITLQSFFLPRIKVIKVLMALGASRHAGFQFLTITASRNLTSLKSK